MSYPRPVGSEDAIWLTYPLIHTLCFILRSYNSLDVVFLLFGTWVYVSILQL